MVRRTREQIDAEIVDRACALFARHGYAHTSLQQVADEVGYSKAGLLHRFASKEAIYRAAVRAAEQQTTTVVAGLGDLTAGPERDRALLDALLTTAWTWPGVAEFLQSITGTAAEDTPPELVQVGLETARLFGLGQDDTSDERLIRVLSASTGLHTSAMAAARQDRQREWRPHIIAAAMDALGHGNRPA